MFPVCCVEDAPPGARASRPHNIRHSLGHLRHTDRPATAPWVSLGLAIAVHADRVAACNVALTLSDLHQGIRMRAGRPRSRGDHLYHETGTGDRTGTPALPGGSHRRGGEPQKLSHQTKADAGGGGTPAPGERRFSIINMDAQDRQDEQDERLLHEKPARPMARCGFADARDYRTPDPLKPDPVNPVHRR